MSEVEKKEEKKEAVEVKEEKVEETPVLINEVFGALLKKDRFSDVTFVVEKEKFYAHRLVLAACSPIFEYMLYPLGDDKKPTIALEKPDEITINGVATKTFALMLQCCYNEELEIDASNVKELIKVANKYQIEKLKIACRELLEGDVNKDNCIDLFILAPSMLGQEDFGLSFLEENTEDVLASDGFLKLPADRLKVFLKSDKLAAEEIDIFKAVMRWVKENEKKDGWDAKTAKEVMAFVRFPVMDIAELAGVVAPSGVLEQVHLVSLFSYCAVPQEARSALPKPIFPDQPREGGKSFTWDPVKHGRNIAVSNKNLTAQTSGSSWVGGLLMGSKPFTKGHQYWEVKIDASGSDMIGVVAGDVNWNGDSIYSVQPTKCWFIHYPGSTYGGTAPGTVKTPSLTFSATTGDTVGIHLEWDEKTKTYNMHLYRNRNKVGSPFSRITPPVVPALELCSSPARVTLFTKVKKP